jgi:hypothetical protein
MCLGGFAVESHFNPFTPIGTETKVANGEGLRISPMQNGKFSFLRVDNESSGSRIVSEEKSTEIYFG